MYVPDYHPLFQDRSQHLGYLERVLNHQLLLPTWWVEIQFSNTRSNKTLQSISTMEEYNDSIELIVYILRQLDWLSVILIN